MIAFNTLLAITSDPWAHEFFGLDANQRFVLILTLIGCVTGVLISLAGIIVSVINSTHRRRVEADLKREMLDRGMSADEVVKVIESAAPPEDPTGRWIASWCKHKK
jgi:hypothetical protein